MGTSGISEVNNYKLESFPNGDLQITEKRTGPVRGVILIAVALVMGYLAYKVNGDIQYLYGLGFLLFGFGGGMDLWRYFRPLRIYISKTLDNVDIQTLRLTARIPAREIRYFKYWHEEYRASTAGTVLNVGPKNHLQGVQLVLENGSTYQLLVLKSGQLFSEGAAQEDAAKIMEAMQAAFRSHVEYM